MHAEIDVEDIPLKFRYLEIEAHDSCPSETIERKTIGPTWQTNLDATRRVGDNWLRDGRTALLLVPSVVVPATWNALVNPLHPASAKIRVAHVHEHRMDPRLWR
jgi:RES domain-containing protein